VSIQEYLAGSSLRANLAMLCEETKGRGTAGERDADGKVKWFDPHFSSTAARTCSFTSALLSAPGFRH
jgi:hypothetical protein